MELKELRIGNTIEYSGKIFEVSEIRRNTLRIKHWSGITKVVKIGLCNPIPLTEEWLINFGFIANRRLRQKEFSANDNGCRLTLWTGITVPGFFYLDMIEIKYIHQLQNLYFALTGEELQINL